MGALAAIAGPQAVKSGIEAGFNLVNQQISALTQRRLLRNQYDEYFNAAQRAGATPAAIAAGLTGSGASQTPSVSAGAPFPDIGQRFINAKVAEAESQKAFSEADINRMRLRFEPKKYYADVMRSFSEAFRNVKEGKFAEANRNYVIELARTVADKRPWEIDTMKQGLINMLAQYEQIKSDTYKNYKEGSYFDSASFNQYNEGFNKQLDGFVKQWSVDLLASGWNINQNTKDNIFRLAFTNPDQFKSLLSNSISSLNLIDQKLEQLLGENYKRYAALGIAARYLNDRIGKHKFGKSERFRNYMSGISSIIPFAPGTKGTEVRGFRRY